jgi:hypothetical protein
MVAEKEGDVRRIDRLPRYIEKLLPAAGAAVTFGVSLQAAQASQEKENGKKKSKRLKFEEDFEMRHGMCIYFCVCVCVCV